MRIIKYLVAIAALFILLQPVSATLVNVSPMETGTAMLSDSFKHDSNYMPEEQVFFMGIIGIVCLAISRIYKQAEDVFACAAILPNGMCAWFSIFMTQETTKVVVVGTTATIVNSEVIVSNPYLTAIFSVITVAAILNGIWVFFLQDADKKTSGENQTGGL
jgi:lysylphosphatidylglycerol synthetase-like protein (DUF2156 family)